MSNKSLFFALFALVLILPGCETFDFDWDGASESDISSREGARIDDPMLLQYSWCGTSNDTLPLVGYVQQEHRLVFESSGFLTADTLSYRTNGDLVGSATHRMTCDSIGRRSLACARRGRSGTEDYPYRFSGFDLYVDLGLGTSRFWPCSGDEERRFP